MALGFIVVPYAMYTGSVPFPPGTHFIVTETLDEIVTEDGVSRLITEN